MSDMELTKMATDSECHLVKLRKTANIAAACNGSRRNLGMRNKQLRKDPIYFGVEKNYSFSFVLYIENCSDFFWFGMFHVFLFF